MARKRGDQFGGGGSMASRGPNFRRGGGRVQVTSASGSPGPAGGTMYQGPWYGARGGRMVGGYSSMSGRNNPSGKYKFQSAGTPNRSSGRYSANPSVEAEMVAKRTRKRLPGTR